MLGLEMVVMAWSHGLDLVYSIITVKQCPSITINRRVVDIQKSVEHKFIQVVQYFDIYAVLSLPGTAKIYMPIISMAWCNTAVTPFLTHWSYCSLALSHRYMIYVISMVQSSQQCDYDGDLVPILNTSATTMLTEGGWVAHSNKECLIMTTCTAASDDPTGPHDDLWLYFHGANVVVTTQIARFMGPKWGPSGAERTQGGLMLAPWTLLSGYIVAPLTTTSAPWQLLISSLSVS